MVMSMKGGVIERARWRDVFGHAEFRALFVAGVLSVAGDQLARVALSVLVFDRTNARLVVLKQVGSRKDRLEFALV